jgi:hypothetical protein
VVIQFAATSDHDRKHENPKFARRNMIHMIPVQWQQMYTHQAYNTHQWCMHTNALYVPLTGDFERPPELPISRRMSLIGDSFNRHGLLPRAYLYACKPCMTDQSRCTASSSSTLPRASSTFATCNW